MSGENTTLGLDALGQDDFSIDLDGKLVEETGIPPASTQTTPANTITTGTPSEEPPTGGQPDIVAEDKDKDKTPDGMSNSSPGLSKIYSSLATHLSKEGVLSSLIEDDDIKGVTDADKLAEAISKEITSRVGTVEQEYKKAMEGGVPQSEFVNYQKVAEQLNGISEQMIESDDEKALSLRRNIMAQDFLNRGFERDEALKYAQRSIDLAEDVNDSKLALGRLKDHNTESYNTAVKRIQDEEAKVHDDISKFVNSTDEVIKGIKVGMKTKEDLIKQIITPVGKDENGKPINAYYKAYKEDPIKNQVIQNYLFMVTKGYTDFSKINNNATTQVSREIDEVLKSNGGNFLENGAINFNNQDDQSTFTLGGLELDLD